LCEPAEIDGLKGRREEHERGGQNGRSREAEAVGFFHGFGVGGKMKGRFHGKFQSVADRDGLWFKTGGVETCEMA
jgi:hypothetical protein